MTQGKITASAAMLNVLKTWGVDTIYGIPSGTLSSLMDALAEDKDIRFLQVRHEETGALAAVMQAKFGGSIGVAVGSGGPGATHLINGVYDAVIPFNDSIPWIFLTLALNSWKIFVSIEALVKCRCVLGSKKHL